MQGNTLALVCIAFLFCGILPGKLTSAQDCLVASIQCVHLLSATNNDTSMCNSSSVAMCRNNIQMVCNGSGERLEFAATFILHAFDVLCSLEPEQGFSGPVICLEGETCFESVQDQIVNPNAEECSILRDLGDCVTTKCGTKAEEIIQRLLNKFTSRCPALGTTEKPGNGSPRFSAGTLVGGVLVLVCAVILNHLK